MQSLQRTLRWALTMLIAWTLVTLAGKHAPLLGRMSETPTSHVTFVAQPADNWDLFVMSESGEDVRQLTRTPIDERAPAMSPDRKTIVYSNSNGELWTVELVSGRHEKIELPKGSYNFPCWSPDGEEILFVAYQVSAHSEDSDILSYHFKTRKVKTVIGDFGKRFRT